ncbi:UNVERIFIED_CONTAM: hypothetical protein FKN15_060351 [Acipenser sinensis]
MAGPSAALGAPAPLLNDLSQYPLLDIPNAQASRSHSPFPQARRVKRSRQMRDIVDLSPDGPGPGALGQIGTCGPGRSPSSVAAPIATSPSPRGVQGRWKEASQLVQEDTLSIVSSGEGASFSSDMQVGAPPA